MAKIVGLVEFVTFQDFRDRFQKLERDYYSYEAYQALYEYYESLAEDTGEPIEFDAVAICGDWTEYKSVDDIYNDYSLNFEQDENDEDWREKFISKLEDNTQVIKLENGNFLVMVF